MEVDVYTSAVILFYLVHCLQAIKLLKSSESLVFTVRVEEVRKSCTRSVIRVISKSYYCERGGRVKEVEDGRRMREGVGGGRERMEKGRRREGGRGREGWGREQKERNDKFVLSPAFQVWWLLWSQYWPLWPSCQPSWRLWTGSKGLWHWCRAHSHWFGSVHWICAYAQGPGRCLIYAIENEWTQTY